MTTQKENPTMKTTQTGKPILDALINASESLDADTWQDGRGRKLAAPAQAQHSEAEYQEMKNHYLRACDLLNETRAQAQRSPLPWFVNAGTINGRADYQIYSDEANRTPVAQLIQNERHTVAGVAANAAFIVRACNEYEALKEELAVAKSQIENHDATLAQVRLNERHAAKP
jgi:hypothetical protein